MMMMMMALVGLVGVQKPSVGKFVNFAVYVSDLFGLMKFSEYRTHCKVCMFGKHQFSHVIVVENQRFVSR